MRELDSKKEQVLLFHIMVFVTINKLHFHGVSSKTCKVHVNKLHFSRSSFERELTIRYLPQTLMKMSKVFPHQSTKLHNLAAVEFILVN